MTTVLAASETSTVHTAANGSAEAPLLDGTEQATVNDKKALQLPFGSALLAALMIVIGRLLHEESREIVQGFWLRMNPFGGSKPTHPVLQLLDVLLGLGVAGAVLVIALNEFRAERKAAASCVEALCCSMKSARNFAFRTLHVISLSWYLPWVNLAEAMKDVALSRKWNSLGAFIDSMMFFVKTTRPQYYFFPLIPYWLGRLRRCQYSGYFNDCDWQSADAFDVFIIVCPLSIFAYGINDWYDLPGDLLNARKLDAKHPDSELVVHDPTEIPRRQRLLKFGLVFAVGAVLAWSWLRATWVQVSGSASIMFLVWSYSAPPLRIKEIPFVDVVWNGTYSLAYLIGLREISAYLTTTRICLDVTKYAGACWVAQVMHELVDKEADRGAGYRTLVVAYGSAGIAVFFVVMSALGTALYWIFWSRLRKEILYEELILFTVWGVGCVLWIIAALLEICRIPIFDFLVKHLKIVHFVFTYVRLRILHAYVNQILWFL